jgi:prefoldin beta subunit
MINPAQLQLLQQNLESIQQQKQQLSSQITEIDSALTELQTTDKSFRILGKLMIATSSEKLAAELEEEKKTCTMQLENFTKQEAKVQENLTKAREEFVKSAKEK